MACLDAAEISVVEAVMFALEETEADVIEI